MSCPPTLWTSHTFQMYTSHFVLFSLHFPYKLNVFPFPWQLIILLKPLSVSSLNNLFTHIRFIHMSPSHLSTVLLWHSSASSVSQSLTPSVPLLALPLRNSPPLSLPSFFPRLPVRNRALGYGEGPEVAVRVFMSGKKYI